MITRILLTVAALSLSAAISFAAAGPPRQSQLDPARADAAKKYPKIVLYSVVWCPHCREVKEYLTHYDIPFINRDVEMDGKAMEDLTGKYNSTGVPVIVFGSGKDELVLKGFTPELFQEYLKKVQVKKQP